MVRSGHVVMLCALVLLTIGVVMVQSAGMSVRPIESDMDPTAAAAVSGVSIKSLLTSRTSLYLVIAVAAMLLAWRLPLRRVADRLERVVWFRPGGDLGVLAIASLMLIGLLLLVYVPGIARVENGSARWINLHTPGLESIQPSEIAKWAIIALVAWYGARLGSYRDHKLRRFFTGLMPVCLSVGVVSGVVIMEDLGTGALMVLAAGVVLLAAGARWIHFGMFVPPVLAGLAIAVIAAPYRVQRITAFLDPYADPAGAGYHMIQSLSTVAGGGIFGRGLGNGLQKFGYLPEDTTDFLFAVVCEELGLIGAVIVICAYAGIVWAGTGIAMRERSMTLRLMILGIISTFAIQALINLVVVTGLGPTKGIALPLISSGGTGWIMTAFMLGLIVSIDRTREYAVLYMDQPADADESLIAIRAARGSYIEPKPTLADRAGIFGSATTPPELIARPAPSNPQTTPLASGVDEHPVEDDEMEQLLAGPSDADDPSPLIRIMPRLGLRSRAAQRQDDPDDDAREDESPAAEGEQERADLFS
ncbi:MAG: FtsW/RodA/SpoVE family cell cycle protein [Phycisphaerales bacterium]